MQTDIQRRIELAVTNGRGYENIREAVQKVNAKYREISKELNMRPGRHVFGKENLSLVDYLDLAARGLVPSFSDSTFVNPINYSNPCGEVILGEPVTCALPMPARQPTRMEQVESIARVKIERYCREHHLLAVA